MGLDTAEPEGLRVPPGPTNNVIRRSRHAPGRHTCATKAPWHPRVATPESPNAPSSSQRRWRRHTGWSSGFVPWGAETAAHIARLIGREVDGLITDYPDIANQLLR